MAAFLRHEISKIAKLPETSITTLENEIKRHADAADFSDVLPPDQADRVRKEVESCTLNTIAERSAEDSIHHLIQSSPTLIVLQTAATLALLLIGFTTPFADMRHDRFATVGFEIVLTAVIIRYLNLVRFRVQAILRPVVFAASIIVLTSLRHIPFSPHITSAHTRLTAWAHGKSPAEDISWYHVAHSAAGLAQLVALWLLASATPRALLMAIHTKSGLGKSHRDEASSLLLLGLVDVAIVFRRERDRRQQATSDGRPLRLLIIAGVQARKRQAISRYLRVLAKFARTTWTRSINDDHPGIRRDAAFTGGGISAELLRIRRCVALGEISAEQGYEMFACAAGAFVDGCWSKLMLDGYSRHTATPARLWKAFRQTLSVLIAIAAVVACMGHYLGIPQPYSGTIETLGFSYIVVKLLMITDPEFKTNFDITNKVLDSLRPNKAK